MKTKQDNLIGLKPEEVVKDLITSGRLMDANWYLVSQLDKNQLIQYAVFAAQRAVKSFNKKYRDEQINLAIKVAKQYVKMEKTSDNLFQISEKSSSIKDALKGRLKYQDIKDVKLFAVDAARHLMVLINNAIKENEIQIRENVNKIIIDSRKTVEYNNGEMKEILKRGLELLQN